MSYGLNFGRGGPIGDYIGFWGGPSKGYTTNLVQGSTMGALLIKGDTWCEDYSSYPTVSSTYHRR